MIVATGNKRGLGRAILTSDRPPGALDGSVVAKILKEIIPDYRANADEIDRLHLFYKGDQPILKRTKTIRPDIKNNVVENRAFEIVEFKKGYEFSHPIQYTNAGYNEPSRIDALNTYARLDGKDAKDVEIAEWMYICGVGYRICLPNLRNDVDHAPYYTMAVDPRTAFVVYDNTVARDVLLSGTCIVKNGDDGRELYVYSVYTEDWYYEFTMNGSSTDFDKVAPEEKPNALGMHPIIEYRLNASRIGYVELCESLFNAINTVNSNRVDAIEQLVQAIMVFQNCDLPRGEDGEIEMPKSGDAIVVKSTNGLPADVKYIIAQLNQDQTQTVKEDLLDAIYEICGVPDRKTRGNGGGDTGQAVVLRDGWGAAEARAKTTEHLFKQSEYQYLRIVLHICRDTTSSAGEIGELSLRDVDIRFTRNRSDNMLTKSQTLETLLRNGVNPEDAYETCELFGDPTAVWNKSREFKESIAVGTPTVDQINNADATMRSR